MQRRMLAVAALASVAAAGPIAGAQGAASKPKVMQGVVYGGVTVVTNAAGAKEASYPVVIKVNKAGTSVVRATIGLELRCTGSGDLTIPDDVANIPIKKGLFVGVQPVKHYDADAAAGTPPFDVSARITGRINAAKTRVKGSWTRTLVLYSVEAPATVIETCTATVPYTADN
jgi:ABC-type glycerol-3-phosphate transport system substrate-binding protein